MRWWHQAHSIGAKPLQRRNTNLDGQRSRGPHCYVRKSTVHLSLAFAHLKSTRKVLAPQIDKDESVTHARDRQSDTSTFGLPVMRLCRVRVVPVRGRAPESPDAGQFERGTGGVRRGGSHRATTTFSNQLPVGRSGRTSRRGWIGAPATTSPPHQPLPSGTHSPSRHEGLFLNLASRFACARAITPRFSGVVAFCVFCCGRCTSCDCSSLCVLYRFGITRRLTSSFDDGVSARLSGAAVAALSRRGARDGKLICRVRHCY
jgi:hypothetical protein